MLKYTDDLVRIQIRELATDHEGTTTYEFWCKMIESGSTCCERFHLCNLYSDVRFTEWEKDLIRKLVKENQ